VFCTEPGSKSLSSLQPPSHVHFPPVHVAVPFRYFVVLWTTMSAPNSIWTLQTRLARVSTTSSVVVRVRKASAAERPYPHDRIGRGVSYVHQSSSPGERARDRRRSIGVDLGRTDRGGGGWGGGGWKSWGGGAGGVGRGGGGQLLTPCRRDDDVPPYVLSETTAVIPALSIVANSRRVVGHMADAKAKAFAPPSIAHVGRSGA